MKWQSAVLKQKGAAGGFRENFDAKYLGASKSATLLVAPGTSPRMQPHFSRPFLLPNKASQISPSAFPIHAASPKSQIIDTGPEPPLGRCTPCPFPMAGVQPPFPAEPFPPFSGGDRLKGAVIDGRFPAAVCLSACPAYKSAPRSLPGQGHRY